MAECKDITHFPVGTKIGVIGAGTMGAGIAQVLLMAGYQVLLYDQQIDLCIEAEKSIKKRLERLVEKERMSQDDCIQCFSSLRVVKRLENFSGVSMVVEAIIENLEIKQVLFQALEEITTTETIFATNTSSISITAIGAALQFPNRLAGWHFFNPAPLMALVEVVKGLATSEDVAKKLYDTARFCGKTPVYAKSTPGFIVNRVARPFYAEAMRVLNETIEGVEVLDFIMRSSGGFRMGPFELMDLIGNDVNYAVTESVWSAYYYNERFTPSLIQKEYVDAGYYGRKTGRGFYQYEENQPIFQDFDENDRLLQSTDLENNPSVVKLNINSPFYETWSSLLEAKGVKPHHSAFEDSEIVMFIDDIACYVTAGVTASEQAYHSKNRAVVMLDLAIDYQKIKSIVAARNSGCSDQDFNKVITLFSQLGMSTLEFEDIPGLLVMRTVAMLANEASDVVNQNVSDVSDVDTAMKLGVGYPKGPLKWADEIGISHVFKVLNNLYRVYGDNRYRISPKLQKKYYSGENFYD